VLLVGALLAILVAGVVLGALARGVDAHAARQRAADLASLAGARAMRDEYDRLFEPAFVGGRPNPAHLTVAAYRRIGEAAARETAGRNGAGRVEVGFPDRDSFAPVRIAVTVRDVVEIDGREVEIEASAEAELAPPATLATLAATGDEYRGPLEHRQGKPMRPDVARAFDRMYAAASAAGVRLVINSAFRSNAEQAALFAARPDPKWVAPPGKSLHRLGTELDLGPPSAYGWLAANAKRFGFVQRYAWEPWHFGFTRSAGTRSVGYGPPDGQSGMPSFVPERFAPAISRAAQRWNVGAALLAAQLYAESNFNPFAGSPAGAQGIAQFMPGTAAASSVGTRRSSTRTSASGPTRCSAPRAPASSSPSRGSVPAASTTACAGSAWHSARSTCCASVRPTATATARCSARSSRCRTSSPTLPPRCTPPGS
jgi:hypothetical protein